MLHKVNERYEIYDGPVPNASRSLERDGFGLLEGVLGSDEVSALREEIIDVFARYPADYRTGSPNLEHAEMFRYQMYNRSALCQEVIAHPRVLKVLEPLLGPDCHAISCTAWHNPSDSVHAPRGQEWHVDGGPHVPRPVGVEWPPDIPYPVFVVGVHFYVEDCDLADGPTAVVPGSHRSGVPPPKDRLWDLDLEYDGRAAVSLVASAGDVSLFVSDSWHRRLPPTADSTGRFFLQTNYARRDVAQRVLPTLHVNHTNSKSRGRATSERKRLLLGLHPECFYDG